MTKAERIKALKESLEEALREHDILMVERAEGLKRLDLQIDACDKEIKGIRLAIERQAALKVDDEPTQKSQPKKGDPVDVPIPSKDQIARDFKKIVMVADVRRGDE